jgi:hypothetical protein
MTLIQESEKTNNVAIAPNKCEFCKKTFKRASSIDKHSCSKKVRFESRSEFGVELGFNSFNHFYTSNNSKPKSFRQFIDSPYYTSFVRFGQFCRRANMFNLEDYVAHLLRNNVPLNKWTDESIYDIYLIALLQSEPPLNAIYRTLEFSISWGEAEGANPFDLIRYGNIDYIKYNIMKGFIAPWVLYLSNSGKSFLSKLKEDDLKVIWKYMNPDIWHNIIDSYNDRDYVSALLKEAGW